MPYPRSRSYATPEETFGITQKPLNDWFDAAASGMTRTGMPFSQSFEDADLRNQQRELEQEKLRRQLESEQAAAEFLQNAAGAKPNALMRMIAEDPAILGSQDAPMIRDYVLMQQNQQKERRAQQPFSNRSLGPALMKQLEPQDQAMFADLTQNQGMEATEAMRTVRDFRAKEKSQLEMSKLEQEAAKMNVPMSEIIASRSDANPALYLSRLIGQATAATKTTGTRTASGAAKNVALDELERYESLYAKALENGSPQLAFYERKIKELADELDRKPAAAGSAGAGSQLGVFPSLNTASPGGEAASAGVGAGAMTAGMMADALSGVTPARPTVPTLSPEPLSAFERGMDEDVKRAIKKRRVLESEWTGAKDRTLESVTKDTDIKPQRLMSLSQAVLKGQPLEGASNQEQEMAKMIAQYALRTAEGRPIQVGVDYGEGGVTPRLQNPANALLERMGVDPFEDIEIPGAGFMGGKKTMKAWELMELRLKEIAKPIRAEQRVAAEDSEEDPIIEAALQKGRTGQPKKD